MVHSAGFHLGADSQRSTCGSIFTGRNTIYAMLAICGMLIAGRIKVSQFYHSRSWFNPLFGLTLLSLGLVAMTLVPGLGRSVNGATRWLYLGPRAWGLSFQPSELVKWVLVLSIAWWCSRRHDVMHRFTVGLLTPLLLLIVACGLIVIEDLGTAVLIATVGFCMLLAGGAKWWQLACIAPLGLATIVAAIIQSPYRLSRLIAFVDPWSDPTGAGYHPIQSMMAFAQGGIKGLGLGMSIQKYYLPEDTTDFLFPIICEELGFAGAVLIVVFLIVILWTALSILRNTRDVFCRLVILGVILTFGLQAVLNIAVVTVMVPTKGIALPLISAGGTGWILTAFALGMVAAVDNADYYGLADNELQPSGQLFTDAGDAACRPIATGGIR